MGVHVAEHELDDIALATRAVVAVVVLMGAADIHQLTPVKADPVGQVQHHGGEYPDQAGSVFGAFQITRRPVESFRYAR